jgi:hypothetical protein
MKTWNLGNTTVRNPERIKAGLRILQEQFEGKVFDLSAQREFFESLLSAGLIEGDPPQEANRAASGRKWQSVCNKLGLIQRSTRINGIITVTDAGNALLSDDTLESDIYLRQLLKVQLPSPTESNLDNASIHPFYLVLAISVELKELCMDGLSKEEIALFVQSSTNDRQVDEIVEKIKKYRSLRDAKEGKVNKRRFFLEQLANKTHELYGDAANVQKARTLQDYSDTTARYSAITGIFGMGRQSIVIKEDQYNLAKAIVTTGPPPILSGDDFLDMFHNPMLPALPTDNTDFLLRDISTLVKRLDELSKQTGSTKENRINVRSADILALKRRREDLEQELISLKEIQFYHAQNNPEQVEDIRNLFESIKAREIIGGSDYRPAWAEWGVWRIFLSINTISNPVNQTRGFKLNSELYPTHHAKAGAADLCFEYKNNIVIPAEVTLATNERQFNMEGEAVKFHVKSVVEANQGSTVIGVFTAPEIHVATAHEFFGAEFYSQKMGRVVKLDIVPLTFEQIESLLPGQSNSCNNGDQLLSKLKDLIRLKDRSKDGSIWLQQINDNLM